MHLIKYQQFIKESEKIKYSFDELPVESQKMAIEKNRDIEIEIDDWYSPIVEGFVEEIEECGIEDVKCEFTGFGSQGDGASFTGKVKDNKKFIFGILEMGRFEPWTYLDRLKSKTELRDNVLKDLDENLYLWIERTSFRYYHQNTVRLSLEYNSDENFSIKIGHEVEIDLNIDEFLNKLIDEGTEWVRRKSVDLYRRLEEYYDELQSDEYVADSLRSGDYEFDIEGNII